MLAGLWLRAGKGMGHQVVGESREGKAFPGCLCIENETYNDDGNGQGGDQCHVNVMS